MRHDGEAAPTPLVQPDLERRVVGTAYTVTAAASEYIDAEGVLPEHFSLPAAQTCWAFLCKQAATSENRGFDDIIIADYIVRYPELVREGCSAEVLRSFMGEALDARDEVETIEHVTVLKELAYRRKIAALLANANRLIHQRSHGAETVVGGLVRDLSLAHNQSVATEVVGAEVVFENETLPEIENPAKKAGFKSGFAELDKSVALERGRMVVVGARPGMGKSLVGMQLTANIIELNPNVTALVFSFEMKPNEIMRRLTSYWSNVPASWIAGDGPRSDRDYMARASDVGNRPALSRLRFAQGSASTVEDIVRLARREKAVNPAFNVLVVDYIGIVPSADPSMRRQEAVSQVTGMLKQLALDLDVLVIALSQLNRNSESEGRQPRASDLRDSGSAEQDADIVLLLHSTMPSNEDSPPPVADRIVIAKSRDSRGGAAPVPITFDGVVPSFRPAGRVLPAVHDMGAPPVPGSPVPPPWTGG